MPRSLLPPGKNPGMHWIEGCVCSRAGLDVLLKRKISFPRPNLNPRVPWPVISCMYQLWYPDALWLWILTANKNVVSDIYAQTHVHTYCVYILPGTQFVPFYGPSSVVVIYFPNCSTIMKMLNFFRYGIQYSYKLYRCCHIICDTVQSDRSELAFQRILPYNLNIL